MFQISRVPQNAQLIVAILVVFALPSSKMYACAQVQEEAKIVKEDKTDQDEIIVIEAEPDAKVETDSNAAAAPPVMEKRDAPEEDIKEEDINKPWVEIVSPATQEANESDASSNAAAAKGITLKDLSWLFPLLAVLLILLVLGWLLALMTRFIHRNDKYTDENVGQTEAEFGRIFLGRPSSVDDLTRIEGVDSGMQGRLNAAGIYQFAQLKNMTPGQRAVLGRKVGLPRLGRAAASSFGALAEVDSSGTAGVTGSVAGVVAASAAAAGAAVASSAKSVSAKSVSAESSSYRTASFKPATSHPAASKPNSESKPKSVKVDPATASTVREPHFNKKNKMAGVAEQNSGQASIVAKGAAGKNNSTSPNVNSSNQPSSTNTPTNKTGKTGKTGQGGSAANVVSSFAGQKAASNSRPVSSAKSAQQSSKGDRDLTSCFSTTYSSPPADPDDLTRLAGIDAAAAARLNSIGIYKFDQLDDLNEQQEALLSAQFGLEDAEFSDWRRCVYAWGRGIDTSAEIEGVHEAGELHGVSLSKIADGVFDGEKLVASSEQVIFCGSNPEGWGSGSGDEMEGVSKSLSCDAIRSDINYLRIRRTDTGESVVVPMTKGQLFANGDPSENGWNGSSEVFFGGRHIGAFAQHLPQEVETKFSQGGWGFGHRYDHNDRQEWGWAGRVIEPTTFEISVGCAGEDPGTLVFRSSDPSIWNTATHDGEDRIAAPISSVAHPVNFVRIMRTATGEAVIVRVDGNHVLDEGFDPRCGWNGSGSEFSGGMHLGVYHSDLPQDFETRFEFGGWGFGHPYDDNDRQAWGWAGRQLPETVFEISLLESVPEFMRHEVVE